MADTYLSDQDLGKRYGVHRTTIWRWVKTHDFPQPIRLSTGCTRWPESAVADWESERLEEVAQ